MLKFLCNIYHRSRRKIYAPDAGPRGRKLKANCPCINPVRRGKKRKLIPVDVHV